MQVTKFIVYVMVGFNILLAGWLALYMLYDPESWYYFVPGVTDTGMYNQHFIRDIGIIQGFMSGFAFWVAGIEGAIFWGTVMTVLSIVPGLGGALVWVPAVIIWALLGHVAAAAALAAFCGLVVGTVDNVLRPRLVGRDTQMHTLLIFVSTLGGLSLFGFTGFILGPVLAALFVTAWELFGVAFSRQLTDPATHPLLADATPAAEPTSGAEV